MTEFSSDQLPPFDKNINKVQIFIQTLLNKYTQGQNLRWDNNSTNYNPETALLIKNMFNTLFADKLSEWQSPQLPTLERQRRVNIDENNQPTINLKETAETFAKLVNTGKVSIIIISGKNGQEQKPYDFEIIKATGTQRTLKGIHINLLIPLTANMDIQDTTRGTLVENMIIDTVLLDEQLSKLKLRRFSYAPPTDGYIRTCRHFEQPDQTVDYKI